MKRLIALLTLTVATMLAQTISITVPGTGEPSINAAFSANGVQNLAAQITSASASAVWPNAATSVPQSTTLGASMTTNTTTATLSSAAGLAVCNGLLIDAEAMLVTGMGPLVVQRATVGTVAATHAQNAPVTVLRVGSYTCELKALWADQLNILVSTKLTASAVSQSSAALTAQATAIAALAAAAVQ